MPKIKETNIDDEDEYEDDDEEAEEEDEEEDDLEVAPAPKKLIKKVKPKAEPKRRYAIVQAQPWVVMDAETNEVVCTAENQGEAEFRANVFERLERIETHIGAI